MTGRTGTAAVRCLPEICEAAKLTNCAICGAGHGWACLVAGPPGCHLARLARARASGLITAAEMTSVLQDSDVFTGATIVRDGAA